MRGSAAWGSTGRAPRDNSPHRGVVGLIAVLFEPGKTFERVRENPRILAPFLVLTAASLLAVLLNLEKSVEFSVDLARAQAAQSGQSLPPEALDGIRMVARIAGLAGAAIAPWLMGVIAAGALALLGVFTGGEARFVQLMSVFGHAYLPTMGIGGVLKGALSALSPSGDYLAVMSGGTSAALLLPAEQVHSLAYRLLALVDPFALWSLALLVLGFAAMNGFRVGKAAAWVVPFWLLVNLALLTLGSRSIPQPPA